MKKSSIVSRPLYRAKADFFRILGHPARIRVLELLCERDHAVHELIAATRVEPSNLSHQLAILRQADLVVQTRGDGEVRYAISHPEVLDLLMAARLLLVATGVVRLSALPQPSAEVKS